MIDESEEKSIAHIFAFATINATSLPYYKINDEHLYSIFCVEIKYFAITKKLQHVVAYLIDPEKYYSTIFFEILLQDLYEMSAKIAAKIIGFQMIFLRANEKGIKLYKRKRFIDTSEYLISFDIDDKMGKCTPMCLQISDNLYGIFGID